MPSEFLPPLEDPAAFELLCLELWRELWNDPGAQKNGRRGQPQAGVDVFGKHDGQAVGVQCKQKSGMLRTRVSVSELEREVEKARGFRPKLAKLILATTGPRDVEVQRRARELSEGDGFAIEVWSWQEIRAAIHQRPALLQRLLPRYWPGLDEATKPRRGKPALPRTTGKLFGRDAELALLERHWQDDAIHVVTLVAWGGVGKTSLVARWTAELAARDYDGVDSFEWSFYSQGARETGGASADAFLAEALKFFGDPELAMSPAAAHDKGARLARLVAERRTLLVLDGMEPLQYPSGPLRGQLKDPGVAALLKGLANANPGLCVVTTRERVVDLGRFRESTAPEERLGRLSNEAGVALLDSLGVHGPKKAMTALVTKVQGHALTLNLLGQYLRRAYGGDVRKHDRVELEKADTTVQGGHAFRVMEAYASWLAKGNTDDPGEGERQLALLRLLGLFDRPARVDCLEALCAEPVIAGLTEPLVGLGEVEWNLTLDALEELRLVGLQREGNDRHGLLVAVDAHPLIREYFGRQLRAEAEEAWRVAHGRLFDFLCAATEHRPATLEGLQPLYQAVAHGCWAGREQEACDAVYDDRILRGTGAGGFYSLHILGAFGADLGAVACFFDEPWGRVSSRLSEGDRAWLLNEASTRLRALGRLREAREPMRAGLEMRIEQEVWTSAARIASNLSELELTLGEVGDAVGDGERAVGFANRSGDASRRLRAHGILGNALNQAGQPGEALERFREAEAIQAKSEPRYPLLYSIGSFLYCDLLLGDAERVAWRVVLGAGLVDGKKSRRDAGALSGLVSGRSLGLGAAEVDGGLGRRDAGAPSALLYEEVLERAAQSIEWEKGMHGAPVLDFALHHLTLGRALLYRALLDRGLPVEGGGAEAFEGARAELEEAVEGLRRAGAAHHVPRGLLTRGWLLSLLGDSEAARGDLAEAREIAAAGPMPLFMADIQLHRARLFRDRTALREARKLIEKHGYGRRSGELEDAEGAAEGW